MHVFHRSEGCSRTLRRRRESESGPAKKCGKLSTDLRRLAKPAQAGGGADDGHSRGGRPVRAAGANAEGDCLRLQEHQTLPGTPVSKASKDPTAKRTFVETAAVAKFYKKIFGRNSIDNAGMTLMSSIHFGTRFNNAMWDGFQMIYGDGDGQLFVDFTKSNDVIAHELTHGVTQHTLQLAYSGDAGGLNESMSDCFGSMFRQWRAGQGTNAADWLIGASIIGPAAKARGFKCLRNMSNPADPSALAPQPTHYSQLTPGMDPHYTSGPPNLAFYTACTNLGGNSWAEIGQVWYGVLANSGIDPAMTMPKFAGRARQLAAQMYPAQPAVAAAVDAGWTQVGL